MEILKNIKLSGHTTFKIGGEAKEFVVVKNEQELVEALQYAKENNLKYYILGGGSNVLFDDRGFDGLVIKIESSGEIKLSGNAIECSAGDAWAEVISFARENGLEGIEGMAGIPGKVGGAVRGNAGAFGTEIKDLISKVRVLDISGGEYELRYFDADGCKFSYRNSIFKENPNLIVISAVLNLRAGDKNEIGQKIKETIQKRNEKQPTGWYGCAGSFFENPVVDKKDVIEKFESDTGTKSRDGKIPAGWLIREAGMSGKKIGGVELSEKHNNFILNTGKGTAEEVMMLASIIKQKVRTEMGVQLREEVQFVGY